MKKIFYISVLSLSSFSLGQINVINKVNDNVLPNSNSVFLDASSSYDINNVGSNDVGKGLVFPQVDLRNFEFDIKTPDGAGVLPTYYDGMVVYNTGKGKTIKDTAKGGVQVDVEPGFYYFSNPEGRDNGNINSGKWVRIADTGKLADGVANGSFWALKGNKDTTEAVIGQDGQITGGNFIGTKDAKSLTFATNNIARLTIGKDGGFIRERVGETDFDFVLKVYGKAKFDRGIVTSASTYPDYVFDHYFTGKSAENPNYEFKSLSQVEKFIKENNHLPGVTSIKDLTKAEGAYEVDNTQLSIQTLEKVEELYLHMIEQQKEIEALKAELQALKK